ncbi:MAG: FliM/FliN family flagellar motor switch protein [Pseudomonadota bacterium]
MAMDRDNTLAKNDDWAMDGASDLIDPDRPIPSARGVLSAAEIEALLRPDLSDMPNADEPQSIQDRPLPALQDDAAVIDEKITIEAGQMAARLSLAFGQCCGVKAAIGLRDVALTSPHHLDLSQMAPAAALCFGTRDDSIEAVIILPSALADAVIAKACGAPPMMTDTGRVGDGWQLSAIDCALLEQLLPPLGRALESDFRLIAIETDMAYVASLLAPMDVLDVDYTVEAPGLETHLRVIKRESVAQTEKPQLQPSQLPVTAFLTARLASLSVPLSRITALKAGSTLLLGLPPDQPVDILSGDRDGPVIMEGAIGRKGNHIAVKVTGLNRSLIKEQGET